MTDSGPKAEGRNFHVGDLVWIAQVTGQTRSGSGTDAGAPLLYLAFASAGSPTVWSHEVIAVARSLDDLSDDDLEVLLGRARPFRSGDSGVVPGSATPRQGFSRDIRAQ